MPKSTKKKRPSKIVKRTGTAAKPHRFYDYPKTYQLKITVSDDGERLFINSTSTNFSGHELYGFLRMTLLEIERQLLISPSNEGNLAVKMKP